MSFVILEPPIDNTVEFETISFDYGFILAADDQIVSVVSMTAALLSGTDPAPASRLIGSPQIGASTTGALLAAVMQMVGGCRPGAEYEFQCVAMTATNQKLSLRARIGCA